MGMFFERRCPYCNRVISDDTKKCPYCGEWLISEREQKNLKIAVERHDELTAKMVEEIISGIPMAIVIVIAVVAVAYTADYLIKLFSVDDTNNSVIEQQSDIMEQNDTGYNYILEESQKQEQRAEKIQPAQSKIQTQPVTQPKQQATPIQPNVAMPQQKTMEKQQHNQDIDDFMN